MVNLLRSIILSFFLLFTSSLCWSQVCNRICPSFFYISDSINCTRTEAAKSASGVGYENFPNTLRACKNSKMKYTIDVDQVCYAGTTYSVVSVTGGSLISSSANMFTILWGGTPTGQVVIAFISPPIGPGIAGCMDTIKLNYNLINTPVAAFTATPQPACFNNPTVINFNSSATTDANSFYWDFGDGFNSTIANPSHSYTAPGSYTVTLTAANNVFSNGQAHCPTCIDTAQKVIVIDNLPGPEIECVATVCAGDTVKYCTPDLTCGTYLWTVTGGSIFSGQGTACVTIIWGSGSPQGTLNLKANGCTTAYCPQGTTVTIPILPAVGTIVGQNVVCNNTSALYNLPSWPGVTYNWTLSGGGIISPNNTNTSEININWMALGVYTITCNYSSSGLNCSGSAVFTVQVLPELSIVGPSAFCQNTTNNFTAERPTSIPVPSNWSIAPAGATINSGNGTSTINVTWNNPGVYSVTAVAASPGVVCSDASYTVTVYPLPILNSITGADSICPGNVHVYAITSNANGPFQWSFTNAASTVLLGANNDSVQVTWGPTGPYMLSVYQVSFPNNCQSSTVTRTVFAYPTPALTGPTSVCADNTETYTITNILTGNFNWFVTPASFGTILSGQGTPTITIKWHGNNSPGSSNTVFLHYGVCGKDSIAITINEPTLPVITASGTLCGVGGITLSTGATGIFTWTGPGVPPPGNTSSITGITVPGLYTVVIQNYNGSGCTVTKSYTIPDIGRPVASISATNVLYYCLPALPNMNLVAVNGPGYSFQWYNSAGILTGETSPTLLINTLTSAGSYSYYCVVTLGGCVVTSNIITIVIQNCPGPGCAATLGVTGISGCNPFTLSFAATGPSGATISGTGNPAITHLENGYTIPGATTISYNSIGNKQVRICADVLLPDLSICRACKDTTVNVPVAADFTSVVNCRSIQLYDASTVAFPGTISSMSWAVGYNPGNTPVPLPIASFNNNTIANPLLSITQSGSYIVTHTVTSGPCTTSFKDTFDIVIADAAFTLANSCVGTPITFTGTVPAPTHYWDFGDAATSYVNPTSHAYATAGLFAVTHIVTLANGCMDTVINSTSIVAPPVCTVTTSGPTTFCFGDSVILGSSCTGLTSYQWFNNGVAIPGQISPTDTVKQTGNYYFTAVDINGCIVKSDTIAVSVIQAPNATITTVGSRCFGTDFTAIVPPCGGCSYQWLFDGSPAGTGNSITGTVGTAPLTTGSHTIIVQVMNPFGCMASDTVMVVFNALPTVTIAVTGPVPFCSNNAYVLTASSSAAIPTWSWTVGLGNTVISTNSILNTSAAGLYKVTVTDGVTGCSNLAFETIMPGPDLRLFPAGCDTLCDTSKLFIPLPSFNGNLTGYTIDWYRNAPPYSSIVGSGPSIMLNTLPLGNSTLSVIVTAPNGCIDTSNIYSIFIKPCAVVLPLTSISLDARWQNGIANVRWSTIGEQNIDYHVLERSTNAINFISIGTISSKGNSTEKQYYTFDDTRSADGGVYYYRIKTVGINGKTSYSNVVKLTTTGISTNSMRLVPNFTTGLSTAIVFMEVNSNAVLSVRGIDGRMVTSIKLNLLKGMNQVPINLGTSPKGMYLVTINSTVVTLTEKLMIVGD